MLIFIYAVLLCVACSAGYYGANCNQLCPPYLYGLGCKHSCDCSSCHHIYGCITSTITAGRQIYTQLFLRFQHDSDSPLLRFFLSKTC